MTYHEFLRNNYLPLKVKSLLSRSQLNAKQIDRIISEMDFSQLDNSIECNFSDVANTLDRKRIEGLIISTTERLAKSDRYEYFLANMSILFHGQPAMADKVIVNLLENNKLEVTLENGTKLESHRSKYELQAQIRTMVPEFVIGWPAMDILMTSHPTQIILKFSEPKEYVVEISKVFGSKVIIDERRDSNTDSGTEGQKVKAVKPKSVRKKPKQSEDISS